MISKIARVIPQLTKYNYAQKMAYTKLMPFRSSVFYFSDEKKSPIKPHKPLSSDEPMINA